MVSVDQAESRPELSKGAVLPRQIFLFDTNTHCDTCDKQRLNPSFKQWQTLSGKVQPTLSISTFIDGVHLIVFQALFIQKFFLAFTSTKSIFF